MSLSQWGTVGGLLLVLIAVIGIFYRMGKQQQLFSTNIATTEKLIAKMEEHIGDLAIHINPMLEAREYQERKEFQKEVKFRLEEIAKK